MGTFSNRNTLNEKTAVSVAEHDNELRKLAGFKTIHSKLLGGKPRVAGRQIVLVCLLACLFCEPLSLIRVNHRSMGNLLVATPLMKIYSPPLSTGNGKMGRQKRIFIESQTL